MRLKEAHRPASPSSNRPAPGLVRRSNALADPIFLAMLGTLLLNDFVLKSAVPGWVTGKISDFAGLFAFAFFAGVLLHRHAFGVHAAVALFFTLWKLPVSSGFIDAWNASAPFQVARVVDPSDLLALFVLPFSYVRLRRGSRFSVPVILRAAIALLSVFAFAATSYHGYEEFNEKFTYRGSPDALLKALEAEGVVLHQALDQSAPKGSWWLEVPSDLCGKSWGIDALVVLSPVPSDGTPSVRATELHLREMNHDCPLGRKARDKLLQAFKDHVLVPLDVELR